MKLSSRGGGTLKSKESSISLLALRLSFILSMVLLVGLIMFAANYEISKEAKEAATVKAKTDLATGYEILDKEYPGAWHVQGDSLYKGDVLMNDNFYIVDKIGELTGDTVTLFCGDKRVSTNVLKDGERAVGTVVAENVAQTVLVMGKDYYGEANVVGNWYQTAYTPIKDSSGKIIGIWYVGTSSDFVNKMVFNTLSTIGLVSVLGLLLISILLWQILTRQLVTPLNQLISAAVGTTGTPSVLLSF